jgi:formate-dependent nitrite reductase membrane component NrfD
MSAFEYFSVFMSIILGLALVAAALLKGYLDRQVLEEPDTLERLVMLAILALLFGIAARTPARTY